MTTTATHPAHADTERRQPVRPQLPLWAVLAGGLAVSVALAFGLRALGREFADVPAGLTALKPATFLSATILTVLGNGLGFYISFRAKPGPYSTRLFLGMAAFWTLVGIAISATKLPSSANVGSVITTIAVALAPTLLMVPALLTLVPRSKDSDDHEPH